MKRKQLSLLGIITCLIAIGYLGGVFTKEAYYLEYERYDECEYTTSENFDVDVWFASSDCEDEQRTKGVKPTIVKSDCSHVHEKDLENTCDTEQVFDPRGTLLTILVVSLGLLVLLYRRSD